MIVQAGISGFWLNAYSMIVHQLSTQYAGQRNQYGSQNRQKEAPGLQPFARITQAHQPVKGGDRQQHHCDNGVAPAGDQPPDSGDRSEIHQPGRPCKPATKGANPCKPQAGACPKVVFRKNVCQVGCDQAQQSGHWQVNQHRMNRVTENGHATGNGWLCHQLLPIKRFLIGSNITRMYKLWLLVAISFTFAGCSGPQSILDPAGPSALIISWLWWGMFAFFTLVWLVVVCLWIYASRRQNEAPDSQRARLIHRRWIIGGGIILPLTSVTVLLVLGIPAGQRVLLSNTDKAPMRVEVVGHRWWWEIRYPDASVVTANQFYLPVERPVDVYVTTEDVIHSFWVPRLAGKIDLIPGRVNHIRLQASSMGTMRGQCAEFCGAGHAHMLLNVEVLAPAEFNAWLQRRQQDVEVPAEHSAGAAAFVEHCGHCHSVSGVTTGDSAPDLSDVGNRRLLGAGLQVEQRRSVSSWLATHPTWFEGVKTPDHRKLAPERRSEIAAWLETLGHE